MRTEEVKSRSRRLGTEFAIVLFVTAAIQFALFASSFLGRGVLLPVHLLKCPPFYGETHSKDRIVPNLIRLDLIQVSEPNRWFMASEYRAGRIPLWNPHVFAGTPFARAPIYSPFELLYVLWPSPRVLPWIQLFSACVGATGAWMVAVRLVGLSPFPSVIAGITFPLSGFLMLWQGFDLTHSLSVFPWEIVAAVSLIERVTLLRIVGLALTTALEIVSGQVDMAGQVLFVTGLVWCWHLIASVLVTGNFKSIVQPVIAAMIGWGLGILLTAPLLLPLAEYLQTSARLAARSSGPERRPPVGWKALPLVVFPETYGSERDNSIFVLTANGSRFNRLESAAGSYAGAIAFLFALPWAVLDRTRRRWVWCLACLGILGLSWQLDLPGFVQVWRLPGLRSFSANRFVFATAWSISVLAAIGLEQILTAQARSRSWLLSWAWIATAVCVGGCVAGLFLWPTELKRLLPQGYRGITSTELNVRFAESYLYQLVWFVAAAGCWAIALIRPKSHKALSWVVGALMIVEPVVQSWGLHPQPDLSQYYPRLPVLEFVRNSPPGRTIGVNCMQPRVLESHRLQDIRGYDGVDPQPVIDVLKISSDVPFDPNSYSQTSGFIPRVRDQPGDHQQIRLHPTLDMLGLRYLICPFLDPDSSFTDAGVSVLKNSAALPRAWVPKRVFDQPTQPAVLDRISRWEFMPAEEAFMTDRPDEIPEQASGEVALDDENPQRMKLSAKMQTAGLIVIGDRYSSGWTATVDGNAVPLNCVNYLLRGVLVPAGVHQIELVYRPAAFVNGVRLFSASSIILIIMGIWSFRSLQKRSNLRETARYHATAAR